MEFLKLDKKKITEVVNELNILLSDYHLYYQKLRNFHWNIAGNNFFALHQKFEEMYDDALLKIDEIAERILTLRFQPLSNYSDYLEKSSIKESGSDMTDVEMVKTLIQDHSIILVQLRKVVDAADVAGDEGSIDLFGAYIRELEKVTWMLDAFIMKTSESLPPADEQKKPTKKTKKK